MDLFPLWNSLRIAGISTAFVLILGTLAAYQTSKASRFVKGILDVVFTLPLVLPPTVVGYLLLRLLGPRHLLGFLADQFFGLHLTMTWWSAVLATILVTFPLMYRTVRGSFDSFDETLAYSAQTLGLSDSFIFWKLRLPSCRNGILAGCVLSFARALGEYGATSMVAGYTPGRTATISTTVYQLWRTGDDGLAFRWILVNLIISVLVLCILNLLENRRGRRTN